MKADVSIALVTKNGAATLPALLDGLARQHGGLRTEIVAVDSSSTDGTAELLGRRVDCLLEIPAGSFDHGTTRNLAIEHTSADLIVLIVQDALPASDTWLEALTTPLACDDRLAGTFARQVPRPEATSLARHYLAGWPASGSSARTVTLDGPGELARLPPEGRLERCTFDNVCSCIRRSVWRDHPFRPTPIAEDLAWAREVLVAGHSLRYVPDAAVVHSHDRGVRYEFIRTYRLHQRLHELFEVQTIPTVTALGGAIASSLALHLRCRAQDVPRSSMVRALALAFAWPLGQYLGGRSGAHTRTPPRREIA